MQSHSGAKGAAGLDLLKSKKVRFYRNSLRWTSLGGAESARNPPDLSPFGRRKGSWLILVPFGRRFFRQGALPTSQRQGKMEAGVRLCLGHSWGGAASPIPQLGEEEPWDCPGPPSYSSLLGKGAEQQLSWVLVVIHETREGSEETLLVPVPQTQPSPGGAASIFSGDGWCFLPSLAEKEFCCGGQWISCQTLWKLTAHALLEVGIICFL